MCVTERRVFIRVCVCVCVCWTSSSCAEGKLQRGVMAASGGGSLQNYKLGVEKSERLAAAEGIKEWMIGIRNQIHEIGSDCYKTSELVKATLKELQVDVYDDETSATGRVVARIGSGNDPVVVLRANMDAEPVLQEPYEGKRKSKGDGIVHAGSNGAQIAMLLGAAKLLQESYQKKQFEGTVILLFQPSKDNIANISTIFNGILNGQEAIFQLEVTHTSENYTADNMRRKLSYKSVVGLQVSKVGTMMSEHGSSGSQGTNHPKGVTSVVSSQPFNSTDSQVTTGKAVHEFLSSVAMDIFGDDSDWSVEDGPNSFMMSGETFSRNKDDAGDPISFFAGIKAPNMSGETFSAKEDVHAGPVYQPKSILGEDLFSAGVMASADAIKDGVVYPVVQRRNQILDQDLFSAGVMVTLSKDDVDPDQPKLILDEDVLPAGAAMLATTAIKYLANPF